MSRRGRPRPLARDTLEAYLATDYAFGRAPQRRVLRIGVPAQSGVPAVFITACNPFGRLQSAARNRQAMGRLMTWLRLHGFGWQRGTGQGQGRMGRAWPAEPSLLVGGVDAAAATRWCARWQQNAVVHVSEGGVVRLLRHPALPQRAQASRKLARMAGAESISEPSRSKMTCWYRGLVASSADGVRSMPRVAR